MSIHFSQLHFIYRYLYFPPHFSSLLKLYQSKQKILKSNFQQQLLRAVLGSDRDRDFNIDEKEAKVVAIQLKHANVAFDEEWLTQSLLSTKGDLGKLLRLIREYEPPASVVDVATAV